MLLSRNHHLLIPFVYSFIASFTQRWSHARFMCTFCRISSHNSCISKQLSFLMLFSGYIAAKCEQLKPLSTMVYILRTFVDKSVVLSETIHVYQMPNYPCFVLTKQKWRTKWFVHKTTWANICKTFYYIGFVVVADLFCFVVFCIEKLRQMYTFVETAEEGGYGRAWPQNYDNGKYQFDIV